MKLRKENWTSVWNNEQKISYAYSKNEWVSYDEIESLKIKTNYMLKKNLIGVMVWTIDYDDFEGKYCGQGKYPLLTAIKEELFNSEMQEELLIDNNHINSYNQMFSPTPTSTAPSKLNNIFNKLRTSTKAPFLPELYAPKVQNEVSKTYTNYKTSLDQAPQKAQVKTYEISKIYDKLSKSNAGVYGSSTEVMITSGNKLKEPIDSYPDNFKCVQDGMFGDTTTDCKVFYTCLWSNTINAQKTKFLCPDGTKFNNQFKVCDWDWKTECV